MSFDENERIISFADPSCTEGKKWANGGVYLFSPLILRP
ncbi:MAG: hypothetical protein EB127_29890, partial [Alphaproteobacteria bacterium]|nr:hypothetical protein [Alphaproteobacteria bacterium]